MRGNLPVPPSPPPPVIGQGLPNDRDRESGILAPRPAERLVGNGDLRRDRGDAVRDDRRHLLLPPLQQRPLAPAGGTGAQADAASRPHRHPRRDEHEFPPSESSYSSAYFTMLGAHHVHVGIGILLNLWLLLRTATGLTNYRLNALRATTFFWHFVNILALCVLGTQLSPRA